MTLTSTMIHLAAHPAPFPKRERTHRATGLGPEVSEVTHVTVPVSID